MTRKEYIEDPDLQLQEKLLQQLFHSDESMTIFDIGACEGESSVRYARLFPNAAIYTFEPLPKNFELIQKNIQTYQTKNIYPQQLCLSDEPGEKDFFVSSGKPESADDNDWDYGNKSSSLLAPGKMAEVHNWLKFEQAVKVLADTLDNFCSTQNISKIDFIHMDVQGAEIMVLKGAEKMIQQINSIWLEVEAVELYKGQPLKRDVEAFMESKGFIRLADTVYSEAGDQFWIRKEFIDKNKWRNKVFLLQLRSQIVAYRKKIVRWIKK